MTETVVRPHWARVVGAVWLTAGAALVLAGLVVLLDQRRLAWELAVGVAVLPVGWAYWQRHLRVDAHGIEQAIAWRRTRVLWDVVEDVVVPPAGRTGAPIQVHLRGRPPVVLRASWGLSSPQRAEVASAVDAAFRHPR